MPTFLGHGSKDGTYYSRNPLTGKLEWKTRVVFGNRLRRESFANTVPSNIGGRRRSYRCRSLRDAFVLRP
jgi:hypothetical protein